MDALIQRFREAHPQWRVDVTFGSSGHLYAQLTHRAPFDLFLSADLRYPRQLAEAGLADSADVFAYAVGRIVLWTRVGSPLDVPRRGADALRDPEARPIAVANPRHAPYGAAAVAALRAMGLYEEVEPRLVFSESVAQAAQFVESGAAAAGILALSLARAPALEDKGAYWEIPSDLYPRIEQGGILMPNAAPREAAFAFREFLLGEEGQTLLRAFGYASPEGL